MVFVRKRTAGHARGQAPHFLQERNGGRMIGLIEVSIPHGEIDTEVAGINGADVLSRIDAEVYSRRWGLGIELNVVHIKGSGCTIAAQLDAESMKIAPVCDGECSEGNYELLPGIGGN